MISDSLFLNTLLCQVRGVIISFSKKLGRESREEENNLSLHIDKLTKQLDEINPSQVVRDQGIETLDSLNKQYQAIREYKMRGHQIRSRAQFIANWERPSRFYSQFGEFFLFEQKYYRVD